MENDKYTGKRLDGRYEIQELIGVGGMATVYKAHDNIDDTTVAVKILKDEFSNNSEFIRRFKNESKAIALVSHPNIVKVNDVSFGDKIQYIVMEYIDGITLKEYIEHQHIIPWKEAVHFTVQILQALQHAHEKGIIHRDMKPQNIMLLQDGTIKVTDFGIARFSDNVTRTMTDKAIGSVHYIAPEQARGVDNIDGKADIYSVGVMLYEMLTGRLPFEADSAVSVAIMQMQNDPEPLRKINENIPEGIEEITLKAMRKDPAQRYSSASEMLEAIEIFRHNPSVKFRYSYFVDETPTKYVESINQVSSASPEPAYDDDYDSYDEVLTGSVSRTVVKWVTAIMVVMVVAAIGIMIYMFVSNSMKANETKDVDVPQFVGQMYDDIQSDKSYKFKYEISAEYQADKPMNVVLSQDPEAGSKQVKENATIKLVINSESTTMQIPKVKNYTEQEAVKKIQDRYFNCYIARVSSSEVAKGYVIDCSPQEGVSQEIGKTVTLIVSDGPAVQKVKLPDVNGLTYDKAKSELESKGFTTQKSSVASAVEADKVVGTDPLAGNELSKGSLITIQVSDGSKTLKSIKYDVIDDILKEKEYAEITVTVNVDGKKYDERKGSPANGFTFEIELKPDNDKTLKKTVTVMIDGVRYAEYLFEFKDGKVTQKYINEKYKIKQEAPQSSEPDTLETDKEKAINQLNNYVDTDNYAPADRKEIGEIIDGYTQRISEAESSEEVAELFDEAKGLIDEFSRLPEESSEPSEEPEPSEGDEPTSGDEELSEMKQRAYEEVDRYAEQFYYTDEDWTTVEGIIEEYKSKIETAETEDDIYGYIAQAKNDIDQVPKQSSGNGTSGETGQTPAATATEMGIRRPTTRFDPDSFLIF